MEVFTISGAAFRDAGDIQDPSGGVYNTGAKGAAGSSAPPAMLLQNALRALGTTHGDRALNIAVDGVVGPGTVKATNYALATYVGAGPLQAAGLTAPQFLHAQLAKADVMRYVGSLATVVTNAVHQQGGTIPPVTASSPKSKSSSAGLRAQATAALVADPVTPHPNLVWIIGGGALVVVALGFMAARRRAAAA